MNGHPSVEQIHDWLDGLVEPAEEERLREHVAACARCREERDALAAVLRELAELPAEAEPARDLWRGIETRIAGTTPAVEAVVIPFPTDGTVRARRRVSLTLPQLYAAGIAIALMSGAAVWYAVGTRVPRATTAGLSAPDAPVALVSEESTAQAELEQAVFELEHALQEGRDLLAPETLATVEQSLATIDVAIREARAALASDPASPVLNRLLLSHQKSKLRILRQATSLLLPSA